MFDPWWLRDTCSAPEHEDLMSEVAEPNLNLELELLCREGALRGSEESDPWAELQAEL